MATLVLDITDYATVAHQWASNAISETSQRLSNIGAGSAIRSRRRVISRSTSPITLEHEWALDAVNTTIDQIQALKSRDNDWNGNAVLAPNITAVDFTSTWIRDLFEEILATEGRWIPPNVTSGMDGEVVLEWWNGSKKLTVYIEGELVTYIKVWGPNVFADMEEGSAQSVDSMLSIWQWLTNA